MSSRFLGETFDIHGGGKDLIFPPPRKRDRPVRSRPRQTVCPILDAQRICEHRQRKDVQILEQLPDDQGYLYKRITPKPIRLFLLSSHYRSPIDFSDQNLKESEKALDKIYGVR
jgi:cysteinyl-tRNA synthetase